MNVNNDYEDDYYETSDFDTINLDEEFDDNTVDRSSQNNHPPQKKKLTKKKRRLEDWLEEKRLRDELRDDTLEP